MKVLSSRTRKRLHLVTGLCLGLFLLTHFLNHALGLISVDAMERARAVFNLLWRSAPGTVLLYGSLLTHFLLALESLYRRQTLRMPLREALKILFGFAFPFLLVNHVIGTRIEWVLTGYGDGYYDILPKMWADPVFATRQSVTLVLAWFHGCLGFWFWMRARDWYPRYAPFLYSFALLVPLLALLGFAAGARSLPPASDILFKPPRSNAETLNAIRLAILGVLWGGIGATLVARLVPVRGKVKLTYPDRTVAVPRGYSVLEASRAAGIPHLSTCGGRGRCSTCRVRVIEGLEEQPPPGETEKATLARIRAPDNVRLACQLRMTHDLTIAPVLGADNVGVKVSPSAQEAAGRERRIAVLFCDLRDFTLIAQQRLPFDTVFLLNRYFETVGEAVEASGGVIDKFIGDGALALFGLKNGIEEASLQALNAASRIARGIEVLNRSVTTELEKPLRIAMGMHAGTAIIGQLGYGRASSLTAIGDTINAASRLEGFAKEYDAQLAVSADVLRFAGLAKSDCETHDISIRGRVGTLETLIVHDMSELDGLLAEAQAGHATAETRKAARPIRGFRAP